MAWIYKRGKTWWIAYRPKGQKYPRRESLHTRSKPLATRVKIRLEADRLANRFGDIPDTLLSSAYAEFIEGRRHRAPETIVWYERRLRFFSSWCRKRSGDLVLLQEITPQMIEDYKLYRGDQGVRPVTVAGDMRALRAFLGWCARKKHYLRSSPYADDEDLHKVAGVQDSHKIALTKEDRGLYGHALFGTPLFFVFMLGCYAGLRRAEICAHERRDVREGILSVYEKPGFKPKDHECRRLPAEMELALVLPLMPDSGPAVVGRFGGFRKPKDLGRSWRKLVHALRLPPLRGRRYGVTLHELRYTYASMQIQERNVDIFTLQNRMGHESMATTQKYLRLFKP